MGVNSCVKVLVVGAGGIGCELLKNLVLDGFNDITIVDLDTIDISNLNRQFLFQRCHVGRSKAEVAKESVRKFCPNVQVTAFHKSIFSSQFDSTFFSGFDIVFNALDNQAARRHVNRLCLSTKRPFIESGTAGYLGQVEPFVASGFSAKSSNGTAKCSLPNYEEKNGRSEKHEFRTGCFECQPRETGQRTFPICTIRNTPSEPVHCVVWAKYLFNNLFGASDFENEEVSPDINDPELQKNVASESGNSPVSLLNSQSDNNLRKETDKMNDCKSLTLRDWFRQKWFSCSQQTDVLSRSDCVRALAWRLFHDDIVTLIGMRDLWVDRQDRQEPIPLSQKIVHESLDSSHAQSTNFSDKSSHNESNSTELRDQRILTPSGWLRLFMDSVCALQERVVSGSEQELSWDKDDDDAMDFVAGAAILRAHLFHVPGAEKLTRFTMKSLAGNIVPAIATTNAIIAGLMVLQARHVLSRSTKHIRTIYLHRNPTGRQGNRRLVVPCEPSIPNPSCLVCSPAVTKSRLRLHCISSVLTLRLIRECILIRHLGMLAPDVELTERGLILISSEEGETDEATLNKSLDDFHVTNGFHLQCDDFRQDFNVCLIVVTQTADEMEAACEAADQNEKQSVIAKDLSEGWCLIGDPQALSETKELAHSHSNDAPTSYSLKRTHDIVSATPGTDTHVPELDDTQPVKRARLSSIPEGPNPVDVIVEDDDDEDDLVLLD